MVLGPSLPPALFLAGRKQPLPPRQQGQCRDSHLLSHLQGDDDEDGSPVHSSHAAAVAHEVVQDGGELGAHLPGRGERTLSREPGGSPLGRAVPPEPLQGEQRSPWGATWVQPPAQTPPPGSAGYLRGLVGHHHALPSRHGVVHVLGEVVALHPDEVAGWG